MISPLATRSPTFFFHWTRVPSVISEPRVGIRNSTMRRAPKKIPRRRVDPCTAPTQLRASRFLRWPGASLKISLRSIEYPVLDCDIAEDLPFLDPLAFPRTQQIREGLHGIQHKPPFIQHDAFGPLSCGSIGDLGSCWQSALRQAFQHLGGPDNRHMDGFTEAENILLDQCQLLEAHLDRKIASRNHHPEFG